MPTPIFICGAECGLDDIGTTGPGFEHWTTKNGSLTATTSYPSRGAGHPGLRAFRFNPSSAVGNISHTFATAIASPGTIVERFYVYFATLPNVDTRIWGAAGLSIIFKVSNSTLRAGGSSVSNVASSGKVITTGVWYLIDVKAVRNTTNTCDLSVDEEVQTQYSVSGGASSITGHAIGFLDSCTSDMYVDDVIVSGTSGDFPIGKGVVAGLYPSGDGTHVYDAAGDFSDAGNGNSNLAIPSSSETSTWLSLTKPLSFTIDTAKFITVYTTTTTEYLRWEVENLPSSIASINGVMSVYTAKGQGVSGLSAGLHVRMNNGGSLADLTDSSLTIANGALASFTKTFPNAPGGGAWSDTIINGLYIEVVGSADKSPAPELHGWCLEVDFVQLTTLPGSISPATFTLTPQALTGFAGIILSPVVLTLTPIALSILPGDVSTSISPVIFTLSPAVIRGPDPNPISRFPKVIQIVQS